MSATRAAAAARDTSQPPGYPRAYAIVKWTVIAAVAVLCFAAAAFWTLVLGDFAGAGFHVKERARVPDEEIVITPECAWPYGAQDHEARAVCRMFYNLAPEQRADVLRARK
jgi:hypothetical protein